MRFEILAVILALGGCAAPGSHFRGAEVTRVRVADSTFDVRVRGGLAEAVRVNPQYAPRLGPIADRASVAIARASGCKVSGVLGDAAVIVGTLNCDADGFDWSRSVVFASGAYSCLEQVQWPGSDRYFDYECDQI